MLHVHRAERADRLADGLAETLLEPLSDPFAPEVVAVPTRGIERWLVQRLSTRLGTSDPRRQDGVCANVEFPFPGRLILGSLAAATGIDPEQDPWLPERSVWPLLETVDECLDEPWLATLERHLRGARGGSEDPPRRFSVVRHLADLFDRYGVHRPEMIRGWADGQDGGWQAELWRRLRARIGRPSPAERLSSACERIRDQRELLDLPARISLFGVTRLPRSYVSVLGAIAEQRDVHVFVLHPSPALWEQVRKLSGGAPGRRREDPTATAPVNRLLASWGRDARELQLVLAGAGAGAEHHHELHGGEPATLLARVQADIRADRQPDGGELAAGDRSIQIHSCHGRARQVEVLRDAILHVLEEDPTLEPRDVIVMCPDIETFAPLIQATFGSSAIEDGGPDLRVRLADRSLRQTNPVLGTISQLLHLADQRATASQLLDLAAREPVRRRVGFDDDDLARLQDWVAVSGIRWGFDAAHREPFKLATLNANTWRRGLDRILLGVTMTEDERGLVGEVLPLDDVESGAIELAGRLAEYVERVSAAIDELAGAKPLGRWVEAVGRAADALTRCTDREAWQRRELDRILDDVAAEANASGCELELADVRALLADRLRGRPTRANFRTGHLTICTLVPMRSVPHRVVCVLGLDDGEFPRRARRDGDDLLLADPHVGDRDPRTEDRQMLLDALMAASERLIVTYTGHDERTNLRRPPAVPVGELLDTVERTAGTAGREGVLVDHPLQPFDPRNFTPGRLVGDDAWGFDRHALAGAVALSAPRREPGPFLPAPLPAAADDVIDLDRLVRFVERPVRALLRDRLNINLSDSFEEIEDSIPVELDKLQEWSVGQRLLDGVLAGTPIEECMRAELARGSLPPGQLARRPLAEIKPVVEQIADAALAFGGQASASIDVNLMLADGRRLAGTVAGVCGTTLRAVSYSRVRARERIRAWVRLLALSAARPEVRWDSLVIGRARRGAYDAQVTVARIAPLAPVQAATQLAAIVDLYDRGMREPLPLATETSAAYAQSGEDAAREEWASTYAIPKEDQQPEHLLAFGSQISFDALLAAPPGPGESWDPDESTRFGQFSRRLWSGVLAHEEVSDR